MSDQTQTCLYCGVDSDHAPLVTLQYQGRTLYICTQHLPLMIHNPQELVGKLPGAENIKPHKH
jgi:hypothetical protein